MKYFILVALILICGCSGIVCNSPYILVGKECCLDKDDNRICDKDEVVDSPAEITITEKKQPPKDSVAKKPSDYEEEAEAERTTSKEEKTELPILIKTNEDNTVILNVTVKPACINGQNGGQIFFKVDTVPKNIEVEIKSEEYETVYERSGVYAGYLSFVICDSCRGGDFRLNPDDIYILRMRFDQTPVYGRIEFSNEQLIDARIDSPFLAKQCKG